MNITTELEKLVSLKDRGDLSQLEFERAKERLLFGEVTDSVDSNSLPLPKKYKESKPNHYLLIATLSTIAMAFSGVSALINPNPLSLIGFALFMIASLLNWIAFLRHAFKNGMGKG
ncbi:SHOCT domain-containing protein [Mariniblastus sp.]|nr:SHOCT domain-containing protein [Mariniblastus sp.]